MRRPCDAQLALIGPGSELQLTLDGRAIPHHAVVSAAAQPTAERMMRSSPPVGEPRPSRFDVLTRSPPSGPAVGVRSRPSSRVPATLGRVIRSPTAREIPRLRRIEIAAAATFAQVGMPEIAHDEPAGLVLHLETFRVAGRAWVATDTRDRPVGYLVALVADSRAHVEQVSVDPACRGHGHGATLLDHLGGWARERGLAGLSLTTFRDVPWNAPYYARLGFTVLEAPGPELRALIAAEARGLPTAAPRVAMIRDGAAGPASP